MGDKGEGIPPPADEYEPLTAANFDAEIEVFNKDGDAYTSTDTPTAFEEGVELYVKKAKKAGGDAAPGETPAVETPANEGAGAVVDKVKMITDELTRIVAVNQVEDPLTHAGPASAADIKAGIKIFVDNLADEHKYEPPVPVDAAGAGAGAGAALGGRRRTKRKGHKGRKGSNNKKQQQSSQNGGRRSCKNRRKQSRRRKH
jgi:hypothetical protein